MLRVFFVFLATLFLFISPNKAQAGTFSQCIYSKASSLCKTAECKADLAKGMTFSGAQLNLRDKFIIWPYATNPKAQKALITIAGIAKACPLPDLADNTKTEHFEEHWLLAELVITLDQIEKSQDYPGLANHAFKGLLQFADIELSDFWKAGVARVASASGTAIPESILKQHANQKRNKAKQSFSVDWRKNEDTLAKCVAEQLSSEGLCQNLDEKRCTSYKLAHAHLVRDTFRVQNNANRDVLSAVNELALSCWKNNPSPTYVLRLIPKLEVFLLKQEIQLWRNPVEDYVKNNMSDISQEQWASSVANTLLSRVELHDLRQTLTAEAQKKNMRRVLEKKDVKAGYGRRNAMHRIIEIAFKTPKFPPPLSYYVIKEYQTYKTDAHAGMTDFARSPWWSPITDTYPNTFLGDFIQHGMDLSLATPGDRQLEQDVSSFVDYNSNMAVRSLWGERLKKNKIQHELLPQQKLWLERKDLIQGTLYLGMLLKHEDYEHRNSEMEKVLSDLNLIMREERTIPSDVLNTFIRSARELGRQELVTEWLSKSQLSAFKASLQQAEENLNSAKLFSPEKERLAEIQLFKILMGPTADNARKEGIITQQTEEKLKAITSKFVDIIQELPLEVTNIERSPAGEVLTTVASNLYKLEGMLTEQERKDIKDKHIRLILIPKYTLPKIDYVMLARTLLDNGYLDDGVEWIEKGLNDPTLMSDLAQKSHITRSLRSMLFRLYASPASPLHSMTKAEDLLSHFPKDKQICNKLTLILYGLYADDTYTPALLAKQSPQLQRRQIQEFLKLAIEATTTTPTNHEHKEVRHHMGASCFILPIETYLPKHRHFDQEILPIAYLRLKNLDQYLSVEEKSKIFSTLETTCAFPWAKPDGKEVACENVYLDLLLDKNSTFYNPEKAREYVRSSSYKALSHRYSGFIEPPTQDN